MTQYSLNLGKDTSLSTSQKVPFPVFDLTTLSSKNNKIIKGDGGAFGLFDSDNA